MSTLIPTNEVDPEGRLARVRNLRENGNFQTIFYSKIIEIRDKAETSALGENTPADERVKALHEYWLLKKITDILDSEERAAKAAIDQKQKGK